MPPRYCIFRPDNGLINQSYGKAECVEAVDDVEEGSLLALPQVGGLEQGGLGHAVVMHRLVELFHVSGGHEAGSRLLLEAYCGFAIVF